MGDTVQPTPDWSPRFLLPIMPPPLGHCVITRWARLPKDRLGRRAGWHAAVTNGLLLAKPHCQCLLHKHEAPVRRVRGSSFPVRGSRARHLPPAEQPPGPHGHTRGSEPPLDVPSQGSVYFFCKVSATALPAGPRGSPPLLPCTHSSLPPAKGTEAAENLRFPRTRSPVTGSLCSQPTTGHAEGSAGAWGPVDGVNRV